ncbi:MAG: NTP transferase domain-containing protein, partial [Rhodobacteraceae bacterium]|nr:NTP transferase domain-containing protein [Paracoccaceae bacterium]
MSISLVILAAGQGTRMNSDLPKVLHPVAGAPLVAHALAAGRALEPVRVVVVAGHGSDAVRRALAEAEEDVTVVEQTEQRGTAPTRGPARARRGHGRGVGVWGYLGPPLK